MKGPAVCPVETVPIVENAEPKLTPFEKSDDTVWAYPGSLGSPSASPVKTKYKNGRSVEPSSCKIKLFQAKDVSLTENNPID